MADWIFEHYVALAFYYSIDYDNSLLCFYALVTDYKVFTAFKPVHGFWITNYVEDQAFVALLVAYYVIFINFCYIAFLYDLLSLNRPVSIARGGKKIESIT